MARYDTIGKGYASQRVPEPSWVAQITAGLGDAKTVLNIGAGTGNYEPDDRFVISVEPSDLMLSQRTKGIAIQGVAEAIPVPDNSFDASMGTFTVHHWPDRAKGFAELRRISRRQVLVVFESKFSHEFWLAEYFPTVLESKTEIDAPTADEVGEHLTVVDVQTMWVPAECRDGVAAAYWQRPENYLRPEVQQSMSYLAMLTDEQRSAGTKRLADELANGEWETKYGYLKQQDQADYGYRLVIAEND